MKPIHVFPSLQSVLLKEYQQEELTAEEVVLYYVYKEQIDKNEAEGLIQIWFKDETVPAIKF